MQYELYLRASVPPASLAAQILDDLGKDREVSKVPDGDFEYLGEDGAVTVVLHPAGDARWEGAKGGAEVPLGVDLRIPGGAGELLASQLVDLAFDWAARWSVDVYDPQLGRTVENDEHQTITTRVKRQSEYLTETVGLGDQSTRYMDVGGSARGLGLRSRFYLGLAVVLLVLGLLTHYCG
jgi:hypothetical protein